MGMQKEFAIVVEEVGQSEAYDIGPAVDCAVTITETAAVGLVGTVQCAISRGGVADWVDVGPLAAGQFTIPNYYTRLRTNCTALTSGSVRVELVGTQV